MAARPAVRSSAGASGGAVVGYVGNGTANYLRFNNVSVTAAGSHTVTRLLRLRRGPVRHRSPSTGAPAPTVNTPSTGGWDTVGSVTVTLNLAAGANTIRLGNTTGWAPDIDRMVVL